MSLYKPSPEKVKIVCCWTSNQSDPTKTPTKAKWDYALLYWTCHIQIALCLSLGGTCSAHLILCVQPNSSKSLAFHSIHLSHFISCYASFAMNPLQCIIWYTSYAMHPMLCILCYASYAMHHMLCILCYASYAMHPMLCILCYASYAMHPILCIRCYSSMHFIHNMLSTSLYKYYFSILSSIILSILIYSTHSMFNYIKLPNCLVYDRKSRPWTQILKLYFTLKILFLLQEQELRDKNSSIGSLELWF